MSYKRAWCGGERSGALERLIDLYKFERVYDAARPLTDILDDALPHLDASVVVVPIPSIASHIRQRGYDHAARIAELFATLRHLEYRNILVRRTNTVQHEASRRERRRQAAEAFGVKVRLDGGTVLLVDDIYTTGSTVEFAARALLAAGADAVWVAIVSRQPLEK